MLIQSKKTDYYDYVQYIYGSDPLVVYDRRDFNASDYPTLFNNTLIPNNSKEIFFKYKDIFYVPVDYFIEGTGDSVRSINNNGVTYKYKYLFVAGIIYIIASKFDKNKNVFSPYKLANKKDHLELYLYYNTRYNNKKINITNGFKANQCLIEISKKLNAPIFLIDDIKQNSYHYITIKKCVDICEKGEKVLYVSTTIPSLRELGFEEFHPAEKVFFDISEYIKNVLRESPDTIPPVEISNDNKILNAGFDLKTSFRNRKNRS